MHYVVGIDGGGTGTSAVLTTSDGKVVAWGFGGPANVQAVGDDEALRSISTALAGVLGSHSDPAGSPHIAAISLGLAGMHTLEDRERFGSLVAPLIPGSAVSIWTDADVALAAATGDQPGIVVIAGTGSIALGRDLQGNTARCGGWGYLLGDEGSAYAIALDGLRAAARGVDGRSPRSVLVDAFALELGVRDFDQLLRPLYGPPPLSRQRIAELAVLVSQCAMAGDRIACQVLETAGVELALLAVTLTRHLMLGDAPFRVAYSGGVWRAGQQVLEPFTRTLLTAAPTAQIGPSLLAPAAGAALLALRKLDEGSSLDILLHNLATEHSV